MGRDPGRSITPMAGNRTRLAALVGLLPILVVAAVFLLPYATAVGGGAWGEGGPVPRVLRALADPALRRIIGFTAAQAGWSTLAALALGLPGAWLIGSGRYRGAALVRAVASIPFAMPPVLVVLGFVLFFGNAGWLNRAFMALTGAEEGPLRVLYRPAAIVLAHAFYNFPIVLRLAGDGIAAGRASYASAAATLGSSPRKTFFTVLLPVAAPSIAASALLVFLYCFTSFAVVLVLGGGPAATTLSVEIFRAARVGLDFETAGALALVETAIAAAAYLLYARLERAARSFAGTAENRGRRNLLPPKASGDLAAIVYLALAAFLILGPLVSVPLESFLWRSSRTAHAAFSLRWWAAVRDAALPALGRSLLLAAASATLAVILATSAAVAVWLSPARSRFGSLTAALCLAPLASSGIVLGLGWIRLYGSDLARTFWAVAVVQATAALPFAYRSVAEGLAALPPSMADAAASLGAPPAKTALLVALPASAPRIRSAWAFAAAISLGELNTVLMLGLEDWETLPLLVYRAAGAYRFGSACAAGTLLALACAGAFLLSEAGAVRPKRNT